MTDIILIKRDLEFRLEIVRRDRATALELNERAIRETNVNALAAANEAEIYADQAASSYQSAIDEILDAGKSKAYRQEGDVLFEKCTAALKTGHNALGAVKD
jgi:hypothetical protein